MKMACIVGTLLMALLVIAEEPDYAYRLQMEVDKLASAEVAVRRELRAEGLVAAHRVAMTADLAKIRRLRGKPADGLRELEALPDALQREGLVQLERGRCLLDLGRDEEALSTLLPLPGVDDLRVSAPAGVALAKLHMKRKMYESAIEWCRKVLAITRQASEIDDRRDQQRARELLAEAMDAFALQKLGDDYYHYRKARVAQAKREFAEAIEYYRLIETHPVLMEAAACYTAQCWAALEEEVKANRLFGDFVESAPYGLYRGEAQVEWARFRLLHKPGEKSLETTYEILTQATQWFETVHTQSPNIPVGDATLIVKYFPAPDDYTRPGDLGGLIRHYAGPETILNRLTAKWYLPMYQVHAYLLQGFAAFQLGEREAAARAFDKAEALNRASGRAFLKNQSLRSQLHAALAQGSFLVPPSVWERVGFHHGPRLQLACFYTVAGEYETARALFEEAVRSAADGRRLRDHEQSVINYGLAICYFQQGRNDIAMKQLEPFLQDLSGEDLAPAAWLLQAHLKAGDPEGFEEAQKLYLMVAKEAQDPTAKAQAMLCLAIAACNRGDNTLALKAARFVVRHYDETVIAPAARTLITRLDVGQGMVRDGLPATDPQGIESEAGRVIPVQTHLVLPGSTELKADFDSVRANDLMRYQVMASPQSECIIIRGFELTLTPYEPQLLPVRGRQASFVRAPVLFREMLWGAPEEEPEAYRVGEQGELLFWQEELQKLLDARNYSGAAKLLKTHLANPEVDKGYHAGLHADLAMVYRLGGKPETAVSHIEALPFIVRSQARVRLQLALAKLALGEKEAAAEALERCLDTRDAEVRAQAARHAAALALEQGQYERAGNLARQAIEAGAAQNPLARAQVEPAREIQRQSEQAAIVETYGESYWHYRLARRAQARGAWEEASEAYLRVEGPILGQAAQCYRALCLHRLGETRDASDLFEQLTQAYPGGPYTGEAYLEWARIAYLEANGSSDIGVSRELLQRASNWHESLAERSYDTRSISAILRDQRTGDRLARPGHRLWPGPDAVVNPAAVPWYGDYLGIQIHLMLGFVAGETGDQAAAKDAFEKAASLIARHRINPNPMLDRLSQSLAEGAYLVPESSWRRLSQRARQPIRLACFLYVSGQEWAAEPIFLDVQSTHGDRLSDHDLAVLKLGLAACQARQDESLKMQYHLRGIRDEHHLTKVAPLADILYQLGP